MSNLPYRGPVKPSTQDRNTPKKNETSNGRNSVPSKDPAGDSSRKPAPANQQKEKSAEEDPLLALTPDGRLFLNLNTDDPSSLSKSAEFLDKYPKSWPNVAEWYKRARGAVRKGELTLTRQFLISAQLTTWWKEPDQARKKGLRNLDYVTFTGFFSEVYGVYKVFCGEVVDDGTLKKTKEQMQAPWTKYIQLAVGKGKSPATGKGGTDYVTAPGQQNEGLKPRKPPFEIPKMDPSRHLPPLLKRFIAIDDPNMRQYGEFAVRNPDIVELDVSEMEIVATEYLLQDDEDKARQVVQCLVMIETAQVYETVQQRVDDLRKYRLMLARRTALNNRTDERLQELKDEMEQSQPTSTSGPGASERQDNKDNVDDNPGYRRGGGTSVAAGRRPVRAR